MARETLNTSEIQKKLDDEKQFPRSGSPVDCSKAYGGPLQLAAGEFQAKSGLRVSSAMDIRGFGPRTLIEYLGGPKDPPFIEIWSYNTNGYVDLPTIGDMQIHCPRGGRAIGVHSSVNTIENLTVRNIVTTGGVIIGCEQYGTLLDNTRIYTKGQQAILIGGGGSNKGGAVNTFNRVKVQGYSQNAVATVEVHGALSIEGNSRFEDIHKDNTPTNAAPMLYFGDWTDNEGARHRGNVGVAGLFHDESHRDRLWARVETADFHAANIGGTESWPWQANKFGTIYVQRDPHNSRTVVSADGTGKLVVAGKEQAIEAVR